MGTPEDVAAEKYFTPPEVEIDKCVIHHWEQRTNHGTDFPCDYWDCSHKVCHGDKYCLEMYPEGQVESYCLECSAFFMAQAIDYLFKGLKEGYTKTDCPGKPRDGCASERTLGTKKERREHEQGCPFIGELSVEDCPQCGGTS